jgi:DNA-directed RNA polymerase specialized sigma24 family protein
VLQATFVSAYQKLAQYRGSGAFRAWLKAIARNHVLRALRDQQRFAASNGDVLEGALVTSGLDDVERLRGARAAEPEAARVPREVA